MKYRRIQNSSLSHNLITVTKEWQQNTEFSNATQRDRELWSFVFHCLTMISVRRWKFFHRVAKRKIHHLKIFIKSGIRNFNFRTKSKRFRNFCIPKMIIILHYEKGKDTCLFTYNYLRTLLIQKLKSVGCGGQECGKCLRLRFPPAMKAKIQFKGLMHDRLSGCCRLNVHFLWAPPSSLRRHQFESASNANPTREPHLQKMTHAKPAQLF